MAEAIDAIVTQQPGSKTYRVMTAVAYYAGLRPSEVVMLRLRSTELPAEGWGRLDVTEADISFDEPGEPKTGPRNVPIPPVLGRVLRIARVFDYCSGDGWAWGVDGHGVGADRVVVAIGPCPRWAVA